MNPAAALLAPFALLLPAMLGGDGAGADKAGLSGAPGSVPETGPRLPMRAEGPYSPLPDGLRVPDTGQVRIEQQVTIRISPRPVPMPMMPSRVISPDFDGGGARLVERKFGKCVPVAGIAGVQPGENNKLVLILRDRRVLTASLEKGCRSRDYYSGFLVAKNADGMLCQGRDDLLSRSGGTCKVSGLRQLVQVDD